MALFQPDGSVRVISPLKLSASNTLVPIRTMQRQAYGYRDDEFFKLKLYALHESKFKLVG